MNIKISVLKVLSTFSKKASPESFLKSHLSAFLRPEYTSGVNFSGVFSRAAQILGNVWEKSTAKDKLIDKFIEANYSDSGKHKDDFEKFAREKLDDATGESLSYEELGDLVLKKPLTTEKNKKVKEILQGLKGDKNPSKLLAAWLSYVLENKARNLLRDTAETPMDEKTERDLGNETILPDAEVVELAEEMEGKTKDLLLDVQWFIDREVKGDKTRKLYKALVKEFSEKNPRTDTEMSKEFSISQPAVFKARKKITSLLKEYLKKNPKLKGLIREDLKIPTYTEVLKDPEDSKDFIAFALSQFKRPPGDNMKEALNILGAGGKNEDVLKQLDIKKPLSDKYKIKFMEFYKEWYKNQANEIRKACIRITQASLFMDPLEDEFSDDVKNSFDKGVDKLFTKKEFILKVSFSSDFDHTSVMRGDKDYKKDSSNFKWERIQLIIENRKVSGATLSYTYTQEVNAKGEPTGASKSNGTLTKKGEVYPLDPEMVGYLDSKSKKVVEDAGIFSWQNYSVHYYNTTLKKDYASVDSFVQYYRSSGFPLDSVGKVKKEKLERFMNLKLKHDLGVDKEVNEDVEKLRKVEFELGRKLKKETDKGERAKLDEALKDVARKIREERKKEKDEKQETFDSYKKRWKDKESADPLPFPTTSEKSKPFLDILSKYGVAFKKAYRWPSQADLSVLAKWLKGSMDATVKNRLKEIGKMKDLKKKEKDEKKDQLLKGRTEDSGNVKKYFTAFIEDLKDRHQKFMDEYSQVKNDLSDAGIKGVEAKRRLPVLEDFVKNNDFKYIENMGSIIEDFTGRFEEEIKIDTFKQKNINNIELGKFLNLKNFIRYLFDILPPFGAIVKKAKWPEGYENPKEKGTKKATRIGGSLQDIEQIVQKSNSALNDAVTQSEKEVSTATPEEKSQAMQVKKNLQKIEKAVKEEGKNLKVRTKSIPQRPLQEALNHVEYYVKYISKLYGLFGSYLHVTKTELFEPQAASREFTKEGKKEVTKEGLQALRDDLVVEINTLSGQTLQDVSTVKPRISKILRLIKEIKEGGSDLGYWQIDVVELSAQQKVLARFELEAKRDRDVETHKTIFPEGDLSKAENIAADVKEGGKLEAEDELNKIKKTFSQALKEGIPRTKVNELLKEKGFSADQAPKSEKDRELREDALSQVMQDLKRIQDGASRSALEVFIDNWGRFLRGEKEQTQKDKSDLGHRHPSNYDKLGEWVENFLPALFSRVPEKEEIPQEGIPSPKELSDRIFDLYGSGFSNENKNIKDLKPSDFKALFKGEVDKWNLGGGGGGSKSKGREKPVKPAPPSESASVLKSRLIKEIESKSAEDIVIGELAHYTEKIKKYLGSNPKVYMDPDDVIDALVDLLKRRLYGSILSLTVGPDHGKLVFGEIGVRQKLYTRKELDNLKKDRPPEHEQGKSPKLNYDIERPDITVGSKGEVIKLYNKLTGIYQEINEFLTDTDKVGIPPKDISQIRKVKKYLPTGFDRLFDYYNDKENETKSIKKSSFYGDVLKVLVKPSMFKKIAKIHEETSSISTQDQIFL